MKNDEGAESVTAARPQAPPPEAPPLTYFRDVLEQVKDSLLYGGDDCDDGVHTIGPKGTLKPEAARPEAGASAIDFYFATWLPEWRQRNPDAKWLAGGDAINFAEAYAQQLLAEFAARDIARDADALRSLGEANRNVLQSAELVAQREAEIARLRQERDSVIETVNLLPSVTCGPATDTESAIFKLRDLQECYKDAARVRNGLYTKAEARVSVLREALRGIIADIQRSEGVGRIGSLDVVVQRIERALAAAPPPPPAEEE